MATLITPQNWLGQIAAQKGARGLGSRRQVSRTRKKKAAKVAQSPEADPRDAIREQLDANTGFLESLIASIAQLNATGDDSDAPTIPTAPSPGPAARMQFGTGAGRRIRKPRRGILSTLGAGETGGFKA